MKLKFQVIDKSQTGFARYCPTFAKIEKCITDRSISYITELYIKQLSEAKESYSAAYSAVWNLYYVIENGDEKHRSKALVALANAFMHENQRMHFNAGSVLRYMCKKDKDILLTIPPLIVGALKTENKRTRRRVMYFLNDFVDHADYSGIVSLVSALQEFVQSQDFMSEMSKNTPCYKDMIERVSKLLATIHKTEESWMCKVKA